MPDNYFARYLPLLMHFGIATALASVIVILSQLIGQHKPNRAKMSPYECGVQPIGDAQGRFSVKFYLGHALYIVRRGSRFPLPLGRHSARTEDVWFLGDDGLHRHRNGRPLLCMEKRRPRLGLTSLKRGDF